MPYLSSAIFGAFFATRSRKNDKISPLEPVTGNFNFLLSQEFSLFFLSLDDPLRRAKRRELCSMPCGALREQEPKTQNSL
jgi:hypothetical protein